MDCLKCKENIQEYLDGVFVREKDISKDIERHLEDCAKCRREYQLFKVIDHLLKTQPMEIPPPDLPNLVVKKIEQSSPRFATLSGLPGKTARRADRIRRDRKLIIMQRILIPIGAIAALLLMGISLWTATSLFKGSVETIIEKDFTSLVEKVTSFPTIGKGFSFSPDGLSK